MALVDPSERTAAVGYTTAARFATRPAGPVLAGAGVAITPGLPFFSDTGGPIQGWSPRPLVAADASPPTEPPGPDPLAAISVTPARPERD